MEDIYLIDTHAHLYSRKFDKDREEMIQRAKDAGVGRVYLPNVDSESIQGMLELESKYPKYCYAMMGLHPCSVQANYEEELAVVRRWLEKRTFVAIGEIGIDLYWDKTFVEQQRIAFTTQVDWALEYDVPIVIHARDSIPMLLEILQDYRGKSLRGVFHCFTGSLEQAKEVIDLGLYMGIGGVATFKNGGLDQVLPEIGLDWIILETDAPYLAPVPYRGKRNESAYVKEVAIRVAELSQIPLAEVAQKTTNNAMNLFEQSVKV